MQKQRSKSALSLSYRGCHIGTAAVAPTRSNNFTLCKQRLRLVPRGAQLCHYCHLVDGGETEID